MFCRNWQFIRNSPNSKNKNKWNIASCRYPRWSSYKTSMDVLFKQSSILPTYQVLWSCETVQENLTETGKRKIKIPGDGQQEEVDKKTRKCQMSWERKALPKITWQGETRSTDNSSNSNGNLLQREKRSTRMLVHTLSLCGVAIFDCEPFKQVYVHEGHLFNAILDPPKPVGNATEWRIFQVWVEKKETSHSNSGIPGFPTEMIYILGSWRVRPHNHPRAPTACRSIQGKSLYKSELGTAIIDLIKIEISVQLNWNSFIFWLSNGCWCSNWSGK